MKTHAQAPSTVVFDDYLRIYFSCRPTPDANGQFVSLGGYVDLDRGDFTKIVNVSREPIMSLGKRGTFDEFGTYPISVIQDRGKFLAYYGGWTRCESVPFDVAIGMAQSQDGHFFEKVGNGGPVLSTSPDEPFIISGPKIRKFNGFWYLFYIAGRKWINSAERPEPVYKIRMAMSLDGINWKKFNSDLVPSRVEEDECQASPDVIFANGKYHMFFCYRHSGNHKGREKSYRIGYASSTDLVNWQRDDSLAGIDVSEDGWDSEMISYPHVFEMDGNTYMLYLGNEFGKDGFGLAQLEGDL
jgi:predicted GH43/DUF377 family glycosyl hydrolase